MSKREVKSRGKGLHLLWEKKQILFGNTIPCTRLIIKNGINYTNNNNCWLVTFSQIVFIGCYCCCFNKTQTPTHTHWLCRVGVKHQSIFIETRQLSLEIEKKWTKKLRFLGNKITVIDYKQWVGCVHLCIIVRISVCLAMQSVWPVICLIWKVNYAVYGFKRNFFLGIKIKIGLE